MNDILYAFYMTMELWIFLAILCAATRLVHDDSIEPTKNLFTISTQSWTGLMMLFNVPQLSPVAEHSASDPASQLVCNKFILANALSQDSRCYRPIEQMTTSPIITSSTAVITSF